MAPASATVPDDERARLTRLFNEARTAYRELLARVPVDDPLGRVAWQYGLRSSSLYPFNEDTRQVIEDARDRRLQWREILVAAQLEDESPEAVARFSARQHWRNRRKQEIDAGLLVDEDAGEDSAGGVPFF